MKAFIATVVSVLILIACASTTALKKEARGIKVSTREPAMNCKELGPVSGNPGIDVKNLVGNYESQQGSDNIMKNQAAELGANYIHASKEGANFGTAYKCP